MLNRRWVRLGLLALPLVAAGIGEGVSCSDRAVSVDVVPELEGDWAAGEADVLFQGECGSADSMLRARFNAAGLAAGAALRRLIWQTTVPETYVSGGSPEAADEGDS